MLPRALQELGTAVAAARASKGMTQAELANKVPGATRTMIAHLEQGSKLPAAAQLEAICETLEISRTLWWAATHPNFLEAMRFEELLSELIGRELRLNLLDHSSQYLAVEAIVDILTARKSDAQAHSAFNSVLTFYGEKGVSESFFRKFLTKSALHSIEDFESHVRAYQKVAIRIFGSFRQAFKQLRDADKVEEHLSALNPIPEDSYTHRLPFRSIVQITPDRLDDLGYIAASRVKRDRRERQELRDKLLELAKLVRSHSDSWPQVAGSKRINRINLLLGQYGKSLSRLEDTLFGKLDADALEKEAAAVMPEDDRLAQIEQVQQIGLRNLAAYLVEPYMDIYIATSMREKADFVSVDNLATSLFGASGQAGSPELENLKLRYFNPTQSWIDDRVAKGLVEALMLRRSSLTICMAQKSDTFGKDSEASVSLGQGKPVVVYVPKLACAKAGIDSETRWSQTEPELDRALQEMALDLEEGADHQAKFEAILKAEIDRETPVEFLNLVRVHWADFDLYGELGEIDNAELRQKARQVLDAVSSSVPQTSIDKISSALDKDVRRVLTARLVATAREFERRARTFREIHPLALQVILSTGVLNGIIVVRTTMQCAVIVRQLLMNEIETDLQIDEGNYKLIERTTGSVLRVISKNKLLMNSFWTHYFSDPPHR